MLCARDWPQSNDGYCPVVSPRHLLYGLNSIIFFFSHLPFLCGQDSSVRTVIYGFKNRRRVTQWHLFLNRFWLFCCLIVVGWCWFWHKTAASHTTVSLDQFCEAGLGCLCVSVSVCVYVLMCVYIYLCLCAFSSLYVSVHLLVCIHFFSILCVCFSLCVYLLVCVHLLTHVCICVCVSPCL